MSVALTPGMHATAKQRCRCGRWFVPDRRIPPGPRAFCSRACFFGSQKVPVAGVFRRDGGRCDLCGRPVSAGEASRDHLVPRSCGGATVWNNIALAHRSCNSRRGNAPLKASDASGGVNRDSHLDRHNSCFSRPHQLADQEVCG